MQHDKILSTNNLSIPTKCEKDTTNHKAANYNNSLCIHTHSVTQQKAWNIYLVLCFTKLYARHVHGFLCRIIVYYLILNTSSLPIFNMRSASFSLIRFQHRQGYNTNQAANKIYCHSLQLDKNPTFITCPGLWHKTKSHLHLHTQATWCSKTTTLSL